VAACAAASELEEGVGLGDRFDGQSHATHEDAALCGRETEKVCELLSEEQAVEDEILAVDLQATLKDDLCGHGVAPLVDFSADPAYLAKKLEAAYGRMGKMGRRCRQGIHRAEKDHRRWRNGGGAGEAKDPGW
jgi:hypothetical protein